MKTGKKMIIGKVSGVHGVKGELRIKPLTDDMNRYFDLEEITLLNQRKESVYQIDHCRLHKDHVLLILRGINNRDEALRLTGMMVGIDREAAVELSEDEYFIEDLKGLSVYNESLLLGEIVDVQQTGDIDIYIIESDRKTYCVPARKLYIKKIDLEKAQMDISIPVEILEL